MKKPFISVIVPVYNGEKYLRKGLDGILANTFQDYELILVNDGSKDGSMQIMQEYAARNSKIRVIDKPNGGVSDARNKGIEASQGDYIAFVDIDDVISPDYLEGLARPAIADPTIDMVFYNQRKRILETGKGDEIIESVGEDEIITLEENPHRFQKYVTHPVMRSPVNRLFKSTLITEDLRFDTKIRHGEDYIFVLDYLKRCKKVCSVTRCIYIYIYPYSPITKYNLRFAELLEISRRIDEGLTALEKKFGLDFTTEREELFRSRMAIIGIQQLYDEEQYEGLSEALRSRSGINLDVDPRFNRVARTISSLIELRNYKPYKKQYREQLRLFVSKQNDPLVKKIFPYCSSTYKAIIAARNSKIPGLVNFTIGTILSLNKIAAKLRGK